jgi:two-component sensor histidine kinase
MPDRSVVTKQLLRYLPQKKPSFWRGQVIGSVCTLAAAAVRILIDPYVQGVPFITFFPMLVVATLLGGTGAGLNTLVLGTVITSYEWFPPYNALGRERAVTTASAFLVAGGAVIGTVHLLNEVVRALRRSEERSRMIASEMQHRVKNVLQLVQSISRLTALDSASADEHQTRLAARIQALARVQEAARAAPHLSVNLRDLLARLVEPFDLERFTLAGPLVAVSDEIGSMLGLAIHELATNAAKYGALSVPTGKVTVQWKPEGQFIKLKWQESGGPVVNLPNREGYGSKLLKAAFSPEEGKTKVFYDTEGLRWQVRFSAGV